jgi:AbrB-like transcriptional regulator
MVRKAAPAKQKTSTTAKIPTGKIMPLTGGALKAKLKELKHLSKTETAKGCGYYSISKDGKIRVNLKKFYDAVLQSEGINVDQKVRTSRRGRGTTYQVTVHQNGQILIGSAYTKELNLVPGDEFEIKMGYKHIHLKAIAKEA